MRDPILTESEEVFNTRRLIAGHVTHLAKKLGVSVDVRFAREV